MTPLPQLFVFCYLYLRYLLHVCIDGECKNLNCKGPVCSATDAKHGRGQWIAT